MAKHEYEESRKVDLPGGGSVTVTVESSAPIDELDYLILQRGAAESMADYLVTLANAFRPPDTPEISLQPKEEGL